MTALYTEVDFSALALGWLGRLAVLERWLPNTVAILYRFHCTHLEMKLNKFYLENEDMHHTWAPDA